MEKYQDTTKFEKSTKCNGQSNVCIQTKNRELKSVQLLKVIWLLDGQTLNTYHKYFTFFLMAKSVPRPNTSRKCLFSQMFSNKPSSTLTKWLSNYEFIRKCERQHGDYYLLTNSGTARHFCSRAMILQQQKICLTILWLRD